jgi:hypothetical protein
MELWVNKKRRTDLSWNTWFLPHKALGHTGIAENQFTKGFLPDMVHPPWTSSQPPGWQEL